ncbi:MAG: hypothetical protein R3A80_04305 [Bdellovibrionota bacterium]
MNVNQLTICPRCGEKSLELLSAHGFCFNCDYSFSSVETESADPYRGKPILGSCDDEEEAHECYGLTDGDPEELDFSGKGGRGK